MGLGYEDMLSCTWREFDYLQRGYNRRLERGWDTTRHIIANLYNSSGFAKKQVKASEVMKLPMLDGKKVKAKRMDKETFERMKKQLT